MDTLLTPGRLKKMSLKEPMDGSPSYSLRFALIPADTHRLPGGPEFGVPGHFTFDFGVVWGYDGLTVSVMGKDLAEERYQEFANPPNLQAIPRSVTGRIAWRF